MKNLFIYIIVYFWSWFSCIIYAIPLNSFLIGRPDVDSQCTTTNTALSYGYFLEGFQTASTGVNDGNTWTVGSNIGNGTINRYYDTSSLTINKSNGCCDRAWRVILPTDGVETYMSMDRGSNYGLNTGAKTNVFHLYVEIAPDSGETYSIYRHGSTATTGDSVQLTNSGGIIQVNASGQTTSSGIVVGTNQWYKITLYQDSSYDAATSWISVDDGTPQTFQRTANYNLRYVTLGASGGLQSNESGTFVIDLIAIN